MTKEVITSVGSVSLIYTNGQDEELERWIQKYNFPKKTINFKGENFTLKKLKFKGVYYNFNEVKVGVFDWSSLDYVRMSYREAIEKYGYSLSTYKMSPYCIVQVPEELQENNIMGKALLKLTKILIK